MHESVILVDNQDREIGTAEKLEAHRAGALHRAFSVLLFDRRGRILLQRRSAGKYHSPGLWSNTCCGHPRPGESTLDAAQRRLGEELGLRCALTAAGRVYYHLILPGGLVEHELDHLFVGRCDEEPVPDPAEVSEWNWVAPEALRTELRATPAGFTPWLPFVIAALPEPLPFPVETDIDSFRDSDSSSAS